MSAKDTISFSVLFSVKLSINSDVFSALSCGTSFSPIFCHFIHFTLSLSVIYRTFMHDVSIFILNTSTLSIQHQLEIDDYVINVCFVNKDLLFASKLYLKHFRLTLCIIV